MTRTRRDVRACVRCGRPCIGTRCPEHALPARSGTYTRAAAKVRAQAQLCWICGLPFTADDPAVADHIRPRGLGGSDSIDNLAPAHQSCNGRRGQQLAGKF
jgi:5-methylcytosine-specific restriction endonuclease McrA